MKLPPCRFSVFWLLPALFLILPLCVAVARAQSSSTPESGNVTKPANTKMLGFLLQQIRRTKDIPSRPSRVEYSRGVPGGEYPYRPEFGGEPRPGADYRSYYPPGRRVDPARPLVSNRRGQQIPDTITETKLRRVAALMIRNDSGKTIKSVEWEFTYPRIKDGKELVYYQAKNQLRLKPNETTVLLKLFPKDKCALVSEKINGTPNLARVCKGQSTGRYPLQTRITRVKYTDGTAEEYADWKVALNGAGRPSFFEPGIRVFGFCLPGGGW